MKRHLNNLMMVDARHMIRVDVRDFFRQEILQERDAYLGTLETPEVRVAYRAVSCQIAILISILTITGKWGMSAYANAEFLVSYTDDARV